MKRRSLLKTIATLPVAAKAFGAPGTRVWLGPEYWANPLQDWRKAGDRFECHNAGGDRNVFWLSKEIAPNPAAFRMSVRLGELDHAKAEGWTGFRIGMRGHFNDYRDTAVRGLGLEVGVTSERRLFIGKPGNGPTIASLKDVTLVLEGSGKKLRLTAAGESVEEEVAADWIGGGVALVCHSGDLPQSLPSREEPKQANSGKSGQQRGGAMRCWFRDWSLTGPSVVSHPERALGPILFAQYTVASNVLKMTVQLAPMEGDEPAVERRVKGKPVVRANVEPFSSTASFRLTGWNANQEVPYEIAFAGPRYTGVIRQDPKAKNEIVVASLTCQGDFGFPHAEVFRNVQIARPDLVLFTGDQLYESNGGYGIQRQPLESARLDYLRKWYMFGWAWGDLTRDTPTITLPDDHDVYHGNLWGAGGRKAEYPSPDAVQPALYQQAGQDSGGYTMPAQWVNLVERTQSSHLPDSPDATVVDQNIAVHYGSLEWGGIGFAILEDRKWKSAPKTFLPAARIQNGWPQNPDWSSARDGDVPGAQLLGERQERFLQNWAVSWPEGVEMKAVISATIFCNLATLPKDVLGDAVTTKLPIQPKGGYAPDEKLTQDHDSNGWPQTPRNRALRAMRTSLAVHIAGDQHLASTVQYGIDDFNDAAYAICSPAISNIFPRRFYPVDPGANRKSGAPHNTGEYRDGFGNHMTVHALANPQQFGVAPHALNERAPGFGLVIFDKKSRTIRLENYPRWADLSRGPDQMYPGWPITIHQMDNGLNGAKWELRLPSKTAGLVRVMTPDREEPVLTWPPGKALDRIPIWRPGLYNITIGSREFRGIRAAERKL
jgi:hypothetical protein